VRTRRSKSPPKRGRAKIKKTQESRAAVPQETGEGTLKLHRDGFGFVMTEDPTQPDVFIPPRRVEDAMDGDLVRVSLWSNQRDGRLEGRVEEVLKRGKKWLVGILKGSKKAYWVSCEVGPKTWDFSVDKEDLTGAKLGETVGIEVLQFPLGGQTGVGRVIQLFGARGDEATEVDIVILKHQLKMEFSPEVLQDAEKISQNRDIRLEKDREDLRKLPFVTIDGETARDFDDAICVKKEGKGFRLWVSIADVSHYVATGTPLDREALARGNSVYFTDKVIPMLPEALSNDLCSLRPHEDRLSFTAELSFDPKGHLKESHFYKSLICSKARLTYRQVARALLDKIPEAQKKIASSLPMLREAFQLYRLLRKNRLARGSIDFDLPEAEVIVSLEEGDIEAIVKAERNEAHMLIEEFMVAANEGVAHFLTQTKIPSLYRVHGEPEREKIKNFQILLHNLGFDIRIPEKARPKDLAKVLPRAKGHPEEKLIQHFLLRSMRQAIYSPKNEGHFGLASDCYTHFTSPIRRYPDLVVHRILSRVLGKDKLEKKSHKAEWSRLGTLANHCSRRERVAMEAEWEAKDLKVCLFMKKFVGDTFEGMVSRVTKFGFFVELKKYFVEGLVLLKDIPGDFFVYDEKRLQLRGRRNKKVFKIGLELKVQVARVDIEERKVYFVLADS